MAEAVPSCEGPLASRSIRGFSRWATRKFVLHGSLLRCADTKDEAYTFALVLPDCELSFADKKLQIRIRFPIKAFGDSFVLRAQSQAEYTKWVNELLKAQRCLDGQKAAEHMGTANALEQVHGAPADHPAADTGDGEIETHDLDSLASDDFRPKSLKGMSSDIKDFLKKRAAYILSVASLEQEMRLRVGSVSTGLDRATAQGQAEGASPEAIERAKKNGESMLKALAPLAAKDAYLARRAALEKERVETLEEAASEMVPEGADEEEEDGTGEASTSAQVKIESDVVVHGVPVPHTKAPRDPATGRRTQLPAWRSKKRASIWKFVKDAIGKDFSKITMPVILNEPLSALQRFSEDLEYSELLDQAVAATNPLLRLAYVTAFSVSMYASTQSRTGKPFNPLLGETYELIRPEKGFRLVAEQVSHHPPVSALHADGKGWSWWKDVFVKNRFKGKDMDVFPVGISHAMLHPHGEHYTWEKVVTCVHNMVIGRVWLSNYGDREIVNHKTKDKCVLTFKKVTLFSSNDTIGQVDAKVMDAKGRVHFVLSGNWMTHLHLQEANAKGEPVGEKKLVWKALPAIALAEEQYNFTKFAIELNELDDESRAKACPTDCRFRPDQRWQENGDMDKAQEEKTRLEEKQRGTRKIRESSAGFEYQPMWFERAKDKDIKEDVWRFKGTYWEHREKGDWAGCPDIY